ncbi:DUF11 domain-containing protein [Hymenobacter sp. 15J16-1T3B]|uniref:Ig-like domain-containing protein n=1 Tax=Hymenobacter sp. 15J16-1T3B TaxID=2886941 RepID=UPI001D113999|nr:Ig-like domain-containing protein [Hymenobacter sp. 15J16-1T3B]MCC3158208.1 DUF11 domain-containing protein [Hymenobacter sp. 15J16-1T3B]
MRRTLRLGMLLGVLVSLGLANRAEAQCSAAATTTLAFSNGDYSGDWQSRSAVAVPTGATLTTISSQGYYSAAAAAGNTAVLATQALNSATTLYWQNVYANATALADRYSTVTFAFNRPVSGLTIRIQDIDKGATFTDEVTFAGSNNGSAVLPTLAKVNNNANSPALTAATATATGTADVNNTSDGTVTATYGSAVTSITITYRNTYNGVPGNQAVGIEQLTWCRKAPVAANVTNAASLSSAAGQTGISGLSAAADGPIGYYTVTQLPAGNEGVLYYNSPVLLNPNRYIEVTAATQLTAAQAASLRFDPAPTFSGGNVTFTYTATDDAGLASNAATFTIPIQAVAGPTGCGSSYLDGTARSGLTAEYYNGYFADDMGYFASRTPALRRNDAQLEFATNASWGNLVAAGAGTGSSTNSDYYSARFRGSLYVPADGNYTFYLNSDDASYLWLDAAALASTPTVASATVNNGGGHSLQERSGTVYLTAGLHHLLIFYGEGATDNALTFSYASSAAGISKTVVPNSALCAGPGNLPPVAANVTGTLPVTGYALSASLSGTDPDAGGSVVSFRIATLPANGTLALNGAAVTVDQLIPAASAGSLSFTPNAGYVGTTSFTYYALDDQGMRSVAAATYTINVVNRPPVAVNDSRDVPLNTAVSGNVVLNDSDQEQNLFTVTLGSAPAHGTLVLNANGTYTYTPATGYTGPDSFTYSACDNATPSLCSGAATVSLRVFSTNTACTSATGSNLLQNPAFTSGNAGFSTNYRYVTSGYVTGDGASGLYPEGTYTVGSSAQTFHPSFRGTGHTGNTTDNFLMVNGAASIRTLYSQTVTVVPGRYYSFSAWFNNLLPPGSSSGVPELGFVINGESVSGTISLGESPDQWVQFSDVWYSGTSTTATFEIRNVSTALGGNDLAVDDVYFGTCNLAPTAVADAATMNGASTTLNVLANDVDPENSFNTSSIDLNPNQAGQQTALSVTGGTFTVVSGAVVFTPTSGFVGTATASYTVLDAAGAATNQANIAVTVLPTTADLAVSLTAPTSGATVTAGQPVTFTLVTTNTGAATAAGVAPSLQLPAGLTGPGTGGALTFSNGGSYDTATGLVTFPTTSLAGGSTVTNSVSFLVPGSGPVTGAASVSATTPDLTTSNNTVSATLNVAAGFDLTTALSGPTNAAAGTALTYAVVTRNAGPSAATGVTQTVSLPGNLTGLFVSNNGSYAYNAGTNTTVVTFPGLSLLPTGQSVTNTVTVPAPGSATTFVATASVSTSAGGETNTGNNSATASTTVQLASGTAANLLASVTATSGGAAVGNVAPGAALTLTVAAYNAGPGTSAGVVSTLTLPAGLNPANLTISAGGSYSATTGVVSWPAASLTAGATQTTTVQLAAPAYGPLLAAAGVSSTTADPVMGDNTATTLVAINPNADVATSLVGPTSVTAGQRVTYTLTTTNNGGGMAYNVQQVLRLPPAVTGLSYTSNLPAGTTGAVDVQPNQTLLTYPVIAALAPGQSVTNTVSFDAPANSFSPLAYLTSGTADNVTGNNTSTLNVTTARASDVVTTVAGPAVVVSGTPVVYNVRTVNNGPSPAASVTTTVQLPTDLAGVVVRDETGAVVGGAYSASTGVVTFPTRTEVAAGYAGAVTRTITFAAPDVAAISATAVASATAATNDLNRANNTSTATTSVQRPTTSAVDLSVTLTSNAAAQTAGQPVTLTLTTTNNAASEATSVQQQVALPAGLSASSLSISGGGSYDAATGLVTFPATASLAGGAALTSTITLNMPGTGPLTALASVGSASSDGTPANNTALTSVSVNAVSNVRPVVRSQGTALTNTVLAGQPVTYLVRALNDGPSPAQNVGLTVQIPAGLDPATVSISGGGSYAASGLVTFPAATTLPASQDASLAYVITFPAPSTTFTVAAATTTATAQSNTADDTQTFTSNLLNQAPVANALQNQLTAPDGNTATTAQALSPLSGRDADGTISSFVLTGLPDAAAQGTLYYSADGLTYTPVALSSGRFTLPAATAGNLRFDPVSSFVGNAFFSFLAVDNAGAESAAALYAIPVGFDNNSVFTAAPLKGGSLATAYQNGDVITSAFDANGGEYSFSGTTSQTTVADSGVRAATTDAAGTTLLNTLGLALNPGTGAITVADRTKLNWRAGSYSVTITTVDEFGGTNTQAVPFTIGFGPLPVTLADFNAQAQQQDALLTWTTAQEKDNARFEVERSADGIGFEKVGEVAGLVNSTVAHTYRFVDAKAARFGATLYYRLRQVDLDGTATLSEVRAVSFGKTASVTLSAYPNPTTDHLRVSLTGAAGQATAILYGATGQQLRTVGFDAAQPATLEMSTLPAGTYLLRVRTAAGQTFSLRVVKQ